MTRLALMWFNLIFGLTLFTVRHAVFLGCATSADCEDGCCISFIIIGKRSSVRLYPDGYHMCAPWLNESSPLCYLKENYSPTTQVYRSRCPCKPGMKCMPSDELDPVLLSKEWYGKCAPV